MMFPKKSTVMTICLSSVWATMYVVRPLRLRYISDESSNLLKSDLQTIKRWIRVKTTYPKKTVLRSKSYVQDGS
ncbi:hypothetical protein BDR07DRAFT_1395679 [Suillus spraguei]|nr:hypothetical protein BDR07DRAFT_1395679 [Suillus spraguei]